MEFQPQSYPLYLVRIENCADNELRVRSTPIIGWRQGDEMDRTPVTVGEDGNTVAPMPYDALKVLSQIIPVLTKAIEGIAVTIGVSASPVASRELSYRVLDQWLRNDLYGQILNADLKQVHKMLEVIAPLAAKEPPLQPPQQPGQQMPTRVPGMNANRGPGKPGGDKNKGSGGKH